MWTTIEKKLTVGFLVVVLVSFLIVGGVGTYLFNDFIQTSIQDDVVHDLDVADAIFQIHLSQIENIVVYTSGFSRIRDSLISNDSEMLRQNLDNIYYESFSDEIDILTVTDNNGIVVARARNPALFGDSMADNNLVFLALNGMAASSVEIITREELLKENRSLADQAYMEFTPTPKAKPRPEDNSTSGMVLIAAAPVYDDNGNVIGVLYGADLINRDYKIVDEIKNALYKDKIYGGRDMGTTTIFQEDFRISTNVPTDTGERAITTRLSQEVTEAVLEGGEYWKDRAFVVNTWYVTAYKPIKNFDGDIIGILYVGILEQPYIDAGLKILGIYIFYLLSGFILAMFIARYYSKTITKPINDLIRGTEAISKGEFEKIEVGTKDEIGKLADSFNLMAMDLKNTMGDLISSKNETLEINRNLSIMYSIATIATRSFKLDEVLNGILKNTLDFLEIAIGEIYLIDEDAGEAVLYVHQGLPDKLVKKVRSMPLDSAFIARILKSQEPIITQEVPYGEEMVKAAEYGIDKVVIFQLFSREKVVGFITLSYPLEREISTEDMRLLVSIGNQVGIVVENLRLFEETKKAYKELKSLDKMKDEFLSNVSHELKTPLISIEGYSEVIRAETLGTLNDKQKKAMDTVIRNADRLERLINSILYLSIEEAGRIQYIFKPIQISDVIGRSVLDMLPQIKIKNLNIKKELSDNLPLVLADEDRMMQVMVNLISNAIKFTPSGEITITAYQDDVNLHVTVSDTGIGVSQEIIGNLFERFYQGDASTKRRYGGAGLGLHISKLIVEAHKGKIWAESEEGVGTTIHFTLPKNN
ncbi:MAG: cache domain-containing protein [Methanosarcinaceae archaeon]|nr:cache domain-containing protein [Methanosarcinaceae archaeon]